MKKLIEKFKSLPLPLRIFISIGILWAYPFIHAYSIGAYGWYDMNTWSKILMAISAFPIGYLLGYFVIIPILNTIKRIFKKRRKDNYILSNERRPTEEGHYMTVNSLGEDQISYFKNEHWQISDIQKPVVTWRERPI